MASVGGAVAKTMWSRLGSIPLEYPVTFGVLFSGFKTSFSDLLVQKVVEQREEVDWKRNGAFAAFGFAYLGGVQYMLYVSIFSRMFPGAAAFAAKPIREKLKDSRGMFNVGAQVFLDQCVHHPLMYFPAFYCTRELVMREKPDFMGVLKEYRRNFKEDMLALWKVWVPSTLINFSFMPMHMRIPFVACTSLLWTCILSAMRGADVAHGEEMAGGAVTSETLVLMEESFGEVFTTSISLDRNMDHIVLTASGLDKVGWVSDLTRSVADAGGNITHSKMVRLGNEFIVLMHISVPPAVQKDLVRTLQKSEPLKGLSIRCNSISRRNTGSHEAPVMGVRLRCSGADKPGMLAAISEVLSGTGLNVENVSTDLKRGKGGRLDFVVEADYVTTAHLNKEQIHKLVEDVDALKKTLQLDHADLKLQKKVGKQTE